LFSSLKNIFSKTEDASSNLDNNLHLLCGLMIEAANIDGSIDQKEIDKIYYILVNTFNEDAQEVELALKKCTDEIDSNKSLHYFTSKINKLFDENKKIVLLEVLWEIILEDGTIHDFESNLIRRLSGLLYISDVQCGIAKKKALTKLKNIKK
jgi:uncharacterized tellurite resistance protein B-like protein